MSSKSRVAQESLTGLEKASAPFEEQLAEAWKFIGVDSEITGSFPTRDGQPVSKRSISHGREEWLLRWLLKKLQSPKGVSPRQTPSSWRLLHYILRSIPSTNAAQILSERKFISILAQTLEEAQTSVAESITVKQSSESETGSSSTAKPSKITSSKKRKRSETDNAESCNPNGGLLAAVSEAVNYISGSGKGASDPMTTGGSDTFSAEYMKTVLSTTAEEAAKILGSWLTLALKETPAVVVNSSLTSPFVEIWELHIAGSEDLMQFSLYCLQPLLAVLSKGSQGQDKGDWSSQLEQLVARYIMNPTRTATADNAESDMLSNLIKVPVIVDSANACVLFDIAINSLQPTKFLRRRPQDNAWLQTVFTVLKDAMPLQRLEDNRHSIQKMLQSAIECKVVFDLSVLRSVTVHQALLDDSTDWNLLSTIIKLDANTLLIPNEEKDLMQEVLNRITAACLEPTWSTLYDQIVNDVLITLMKEFANARDLSGFLRHWYAQLVEFERLRKEAHLFSMSLFSAWEDDNLQSELGKLLEPSLTVQQIIQLLDWLSEEVKANPNAVCVILEAISGAITREEVIDAAGLRLYHIMFDNGASEKLDGRYQWRSWRLLSRSLEWIQADELEKISQLWDEKQKPFDLLSTRKTIGGLLDIDAENTVGLETLEVFKLSCAMYSSAADDSKLRSQAIKPLRKFLQDLACDIKTFPHDLQSDQGLGEEICGSSMNTLYRGAGWMMWAFIRCVLVEYPRVLRLGPQLHDNVFKEMLLGIFWVTSTPHQSSSPWLRRNPDALSNLWTSCLKDEYILNTPGIIRPLIDVMLNSQTHVDNPLVKTSTNNAFSIKSLMNVPLDRFSKVERERIIKSWLPDPSSERLKDLTYESTVLDKGVLSLKIRIMKRPTFYEGMKYLDLLHLAETLSSSDAATMVVLDLFKELARVTLGHITVNLDQSRNRAYIADALDHFKKQAKGKYIVEGKSKAKTDFANIALLDVVVSALSSKSSVLNDLDILSKKKLTKLVDSARNQLQNQLKTHLQKPEKFNKVADDDHKVLSLYSTIDALLENGLDDHEVGDITSIANTFIESLNASHELTPTKHVVFAKLKLLLQSSTSATISSLTSSSDEELKSVFARQCLERNAIAVTENGKETEKLKILKLIYGKLPDPSIPLHQLFVTRSVVAACADSRRDADDNSDGELFDLTSTYAALCDRLWQAGGFRQFALTGETMEMMLRTKGRSISQWNIDSTLGSISIICSRNGPSLRPLRAGSTYLHLCRLLQGILMSHRTKLQGHFHLVVQALQALLRCLFTPLPHSTSKITKIFASPPWLSAPTHQLRAKHAEAFTRLVTLICDPSVSSVTRSQHNNLTSATDKAKRMAGQHMQYLLTLYIKLQLDMKMLPEVREKMVPGIYAIFDTTTPELRKAISDSLDSSGRAVFGTLYRDYTRFGKWKGS